MNSISNWVYQQLKTIKPEKFEYSDKGNAAIFAKVFGSICRFNVTAKEWFVYTKGSWKLDQGGMITSRYGKFLADALMKYGLELKDEQSKKAFLNHCVRLGQLRYRDTMIKDARECFFFSEDDLDKDQYILNCKNGVLNLKTFEFLSHSPSFMCSKQANVKYDSNASAEVWEKYINEVMDGNKAKIDFLQKILGLSLTGDTREETCYLLYGSTTRNGKSTFVETFAYMLGNTDGYALNMKPESLAMKNNMDSRQASEDIARLKGCRFLNAAEPPKRMVFDAALLKTLLGRDSITARRLYQSDFQFVPVFKLFINTNYLPLIQDSTLFSSGRLTVISFDHHFSIQEQDKGLKDRLKQPENLSGLLNWCIEGLKKYYKEGAIAPPEVREATDQYQEDSDKIGNFIRECLIALPGKNVSAKDAYLEYSKWCSDNGFGTENKTNFFSELKGKGILAPSGTISGRTVRNVIKGYAIAADEKFIPVNEPDPFT